MADQAIDTGRVALLIPRFVPESHLERKVIADPRLVANLAWGEPRAGHPEGSIAAHVEDLLVTLDAWDEPAERRADLRFIALVHDAFKAEVQRLAEEAK